MKKKVALTKKQKKALIITTAIGVSTAVIIALDRSPLGQKITASLIEKLAHHHICAHKIGLYAVYGSYKGAIPAEGFEALNTAFVSVANQYL